MTNVLLIALTASVLIVAVVLSRGFSNLASRLEAASQAHATPIVALFGDWEDTVAIVNVGDGTAIDVLWTLSSSSKSGHISYLSPRQTRHFRPSGADGETLSVNYKSVAGEEYRSTFELAKVPASDCLLTSA